MSDEEDAEIRAAALRDPDNPPRGHLPTDGLRPAHEAHPDLVADWLWRQQAGPEAAGTPVDVLLTLDHELFLRLEALGPDWKARVNDLLRKEMGLLLKPADGAQSLVVAPK